MIAESVRRRITIVSELRTSIRVPARHQEPSVTTLTEKRLELNDEPLPERALALIDEGLLRGKSVNCFDFVPSDYKTVYRVLAAVPRGRFLEWGSGMGVVTGLAALLGFEARGIERDPPLAEMSRRLMRDMALSASILTGDYMEEDCVADVYFCYCWPGKTAETQQRFIEFAPSDAVLLFCHGASDVRCLAKSN
jgi:hypothetical protein